MNIFGLKASRGKFIIAYFYHQSEFKPIYVYSRISNFTFKWKFEKIKEVNVNCFLILGFMFYSCVRWKCKNLWHGRKKNLFCAFTKIYTGTTMLSLGVWSIHWEGILLGPHVLWNQSFNMPASIIRGYFNCDRIVKLLF